MDNDIRSTIPIPCCNIPGCCTKLHEQTKNRCITCDYTDLLKIQFNEFLHELLSQKSDGSLWTNLHLKELDLCIFQKFRAVFGTIDQLHAITDGVRERFLI